MGEIPTKVLSDHFAELINSRRIVAGVFLTFQFEPKFFEEEVLSLFLQSGAQNPKLRLVELETALISDIGPIAVYYDPRVFEPDGSSRLNFRKVPIASVPGAFHPKVVLLLTEPRDPEDKKNPPYLIFSVMSANLTKAGWWSNLECVHTEIAYQGERCSYRDDLTRLLQRIRAIGGGPQDHEPVNRILRFVRREISEVSHSTLEGRLRPRLTAGTDPLIDFLQSTRGAELHGKSLEVISPFFDAEDPGPLRALIETFKPREVRVFLPKDAEGHALCSPKLYEAVKTLPNTSWARLPDRLLKLGKDKNLKQRFVHAKVYRFTERASQYEALLIGSHNLTQPAHQRGGNFEASMLIEPELDDAPTWWLTSDERRPHGFAPEDSEELDEIEDIDATIPLEMRFDWRTTKGKVRWGGPQESPPLAVLSSGVQHFTISALMPSVWRNLPDDANQALAETLKSSGILTIRLPDGTSDEILVQEDEMSRKPSILITFTVAEILEYWSRLTPEQRSIFLESRFGEEKDIPEEFRDRLKAQSSTLTSMFDEFAGIFHGFDMLRQQVWKTLGERNATYAEHLLLGHRRDSLPSLLDRVIDNRDHQDTLHRYLTLLCARQLLRELAKERSEFYDAHRAELDKIQAQAAKASEIRTQLNLGAGSEHFLDWFEGHFLKRAAPLVSETDG